MEVGEANDEKDELNLSVDLALIESAGMGGSYHKDTKGE